MNPDNPILNSPYDEPHSHYATDADGALNYKDIRGGRRVFVPDVQALPQKQGPQPSMFEVNDYAEQFNQHLINFLRRETEKWRNEGYPGTTRVSRELLNFWFNNPDRHVTKRLFFAQREAVETAVWLNEIAAKSNPGQNALRLLGEGRKNGGDDNSLPRTAFKMATGTGKTVVMACLILYHYLNRQEYRSDTRFADYFLMVTPGITIKDRLGVLYVDGRSKAKYRREDYYAVRDLVPPAYEKFLDGLNARLVITNYHAFEPKTLQGNKRSPFDGKLDESGRRRESKEE